MVEQWVDHICYRFKSCRSEIQSWQLSMAMAEMPMSSQQGRANPSTKATSAREVTPSIRGKREANISLVGRIHLALIHSEVSHD